MLEYALRMERFVFSFCIRQPTDAYRLPLFVEFADVLMPCVLHYNAQ